MVAKNILIVDDQKDQLDVICHIIEDDGFTVQCAETSEEAVGLFEAVPPFMVLTDLRLGDQIDGASLAGRMHQADPMCIFCAISGYLDAFDIGYLLGAVFTDVMQKPVDLDGLLRIVRYAWEKRQRWEKILMSC